MVSSRDQEVSEDIFVVFLPSSFGVIRTLKQSWVREYHTFSCVSCPRAHLPLQSDLLIHHIIADLRLMSASNLPLQSDLLIITSLLTFG